jgi:hypothetical protein
MGGRRSKKDQRPARAVPIPLEPVDLLAGLAPGVELQVDDLPPGMVEDDPEGSSSTHVTVSDAGRLVRAGEATIRRLIRTPVLRPAEPDPRRPARTDVDRAGVPPRTPDKPGE